jgi:hypothetical protein
MVQSGLSVSARWRALYQRDRSRGFFGEKASARGLLRQGGYHGQPANYHHSDNCGRCAQQRGGWMSRKPIQLERDDFSKQSV